jgi:hypothetical protein
MLTAECTAILQQWLTASTYLMRGVRSAAFQTARASVMPSPRRSAHLASYITNCSPWSSQPGK